MHPKTRILSACAVVAFIAIAPPVRAGTTADALSAYRNNRVAEAERGLGDVAADPTAPERDRAAALRELGRIDSLLRGETDAIGAAMAATPSGEERCATAALALRIYREAGDPAAPLAYAEGAQNCTPDETDALRVQLARTRVALARAVPSARTQHLAAATAALDDIDPVASGAPGVASTRLALALARGDADVAFAAWRDFFWLTEADAPPPLSVHTGGVRAMFAAGLNASAAPGEVLALIDVLVRAGFVDEAQHLAGETDMAARAGEAPLWRRAAALFACYRTIRDATLRANREMAAGGRAAWYEAEIGAARDRLMQDTGLTGDPEVALAETFGLYGSLGETSGYPSLHAGHMVQDERIAIRQYGRSGEIRFIVIDNMISNGFESWLWDGWAQAGGWSREGAAIVHVRSAYTSGPLAALRRSRPGAARDRFVAATERDSGPERAALGRDGVGELTATASRLDLQAMDQVAARAPNDAAFVAEYWRATIQYSITLHEGRHALDRNERRRFSGAELEYRAKLSQIALADYPRMGLANVAGQTLGPTAHGRANRRVLQGYRAWMRRHRDEIAGFDPSAPTLSQLHLLSDDQIRTVARTLDPWAQ